MGNIIAFLVRHHKFFIFVLLEAICFSLVVSYNKKQSNAFFGVSHELSGRLDQGFSNLYAYFHLNQINRDLQAENAALRAKMNNAILLDTGKTKNIADTSIHQRYTFVPANIINNSVTNRNNYITLDAGSRQGITKSLGVVSTNGIVGVTREVSPHFTSILSILHKDFAVSAEITENKEIGTVSWDGENPEVMIMRDIPLHIHIRKGMHIVTSANSNLFPKGTPIGVIDRFIIKQADAFYTIYVKLGTDMRNLRTVYVVNNLVKQEQEKVEPKPDAR